MKVHSVSDLHCDNWELLGHEMATPVLPLVGDVLIVNGDVSDGSLERHLTRLASKYLEAGRPVLFVPGNHDYYYQSVVEAEQRMSLACANAGVVFLNNSCFSLEGVCFFGTTLWAAFDMREFSSLMQMNMAKVMVADYKYIKGFTPQLSLKLHEQARAELRQAAEAARAKKEKLVLISHHAPLHECVPPGFKNNPISGAYASDLSAILSAEGIETAIYGHMHGSGCQKSLASPGTLLFTNARGCLRGTTLQAAIKENPRFDYEGHFII